MSEDEFSEWKSWPQTRKFFLLIKRQRELIKEHLVEVAGEDALDDRLQVGRAKQLDDILAISYDDMKDVE